MHKPIVVQANGDIPDTTYTYLYIRHPDPYRSHVGDVDFVLDPREYEKLRQALLSGKKMKGARVYGGDLDMIELYDPDVDALGYVTTSTLEEKVKVRTN